MKKTFLLLLLAASSLLAQTNTETMATSIDGYAARVNNRVITYGDIREQILPILQDITQHYQGPDLPQRIQEIYLEGREALIEEALFKEEAKNLGLALPETVIDEEIDQIIKTRFDGDRALFNRTLAKRRMTYLEWREQIAEQMTMRAYYSQEVLRRAKVSADAILTEYENTKENYIIPFRVKYRFILINKGTTEEEQEAKRTLVERTLQKLRDGADFNVVAEDISEGDTELSPWRDPADVREEMRLSLLKTAAGQISNLIETDTAYYIIQVESRQEKGYIPLDDLREKIEEELLVKEHDRLRKRLVDRLAARHYIERY